MKEVKTKTTGIVLESLGGGRFNVELSDKTKILANLAGRLRRFKIKVLPGDKVTVETTKYDKDRGVIVYRYDV